MRFSIHFYYHFIAYKKFIRTFLLRVCLARLVKGRGHVAKKKKREGTGMRKSCSTGVDFTTNTEF